MPSLARDPLRAGRQTAPAGFATLAALAAAALLGSPCVTARGGEGILERTPNLSIRITSPPGGGEGSIPARLSDIPALLEAARGRGDEVDGVFPYAPVASLWSDGTQKERRLVLPDFLEAGAPWARAGYRAVDAWDFPAHTLLIKTFRVPLDLRAPGESLRLLETRLLYRGIEGWRGFSYEWTEDGADAVLLEGRTPRDVPRIGAGGEPEVFRWTFPGEADCFACHTQGPNVILGLTTAQLNSPFLYPQTGASENQLGVLARLGLLDPPLPDEPVELPRLPDPFGDAAPLEARARAYLAANCSMCHRPGEVPDLDMDLRWETPRGAMNVLDVEPRRGSAGLPPDALIVKSGDPDLSVLAARMADLEPVRRMPKIGSAVVDEEGLALIRAWIRSLGAEAYRPGDANSDGRIDMADAVSTLGYLFQGEAAPGCPPALEANGDGGVDISDAIHTLLFLFAGGPPPPLWPACAPPAEDCARGGCAD